METSHSLFLVTGELQTGNGNIDKTASGLFASIIHSKAEIRQAIRQAIRHLL